MTYRWPLPMLGISSRFLGNFQLVNAVKKSFRKANTTPRPTPLWVQFPSVWFFNREHPLICENISEKACLKRPCEYDREKEGTVLRSIKLPSQIFHGLNSFTQSVTQDDGCKRKCKSEKGSTAREFLSCFFSPSPFQWFMICDLWGASN